MTLKMNIVGAGRLGKTCGFLFAKSGLVNILGVCNSTPSSSQEAINFIGEGQYFGIEDLPDADIYLISTPDFLLKTSCEKLIANNKHIKKAALVLHCSGALTSDVLHSAKELGCSVASIHPIKSFANPEKNIHDFTDTYCSFEGELETFEILNPLFSAIGGKLFKINKHKKMLYHAACVFCSNYLVTLFEVAAQCFKQADLNEEIANNIVRNMMQTTLSNLEKLNPKQALTGPLMRGEADIVMKHLDVLKETEFLDLYKILGKATLGLVE